MYVCVLITPHPALLYFLSVLIKTHFIPAVPFLRSMTWFYESSLNSKCPTLEAQRPQEKEDKLPLRKEGKEKNEKVERAVYDEQKRETLDMQWVC